MDRPLIGRREIIWVAATVAGLWLLTRIWLLLLALAISLLLASALLPWIEWLVRRRVPRGLAVALVALGFILLLLVVGLVAVPVLADQATALFDRFPELQQAVARTLREHHQENAAQQVELFEVERVVNLDSVANLGGILLGIATTVLTILVLTVYVLLDASRLRAFVFYMLPEHYHWHARQLMPALHRVVGGYVRGQLLMSLSIATYSFVLLLILRVPNPLALAVLAGFADMVPLVGVYLIVVPTALAALSVSTFTAVLVAALLVLYTQLENQVLVQWVFGTTLDIPGIEVLLGVLIGGHLLGFAGALLALPATAMLSVLVRFAQDVRTGRLQVEHEAPSTAGGATPSG